MLTLILGVFNYVIQLP